MNKRIAFLLCCLSLAKLTISQSGIGLPAIRNFTNTDYHAAVGIWDIHQDRKGLLYFANNEGLLSFDGAYWKTYPLPHQATIKSLAIDDSGRIYVGGEDEIGYFFPNAQGVLTYHSLTALLPTIARQFADIWNIVIWKDEVFFRTIESIFRLKNNRIQTFDAPGGWRMMTEVKGRLYAEDKTKGLMVFDNDQWKEAIPLLETASLHITGVLEYKNDTLLVTTLKDGLYQLTGSTLTRVRVPADPVLSNDRVTSAQKTVDNRYVLTTNAGGILIIDEGGRLTERFSGSEGLQNNHVLGLLQDRDGNFWLGLENGISFIQYNSSVTHIYPVKNNPILSDAAFLTDQRLFIGTSNGLFSVPIDTSIKDVASGKGAFTEVANTRGQVWSIRTMNGLLLMGHQDGAFVIRDNRATPVMTKQGVWGFTGSGADIIAGTYTGLQDLHYEDGHLKEGGKISDLYESLPLIAQADPLAVWASHPYRGIFKIPLPAGHFVHYTTANGLPSNLNNFVYLIRGRIVAATSRGVYEYNVTNDRWGVSSFFQPIFKDTSVECLAEDRDGHIWFVSQQRVGVIELGTRKAGKEGNDGVPAYRVRYFPELQGQTVKDHPFIYPYDDQNIFVGSNNGMLHINYSRYIRSDTGVTVVLGSVKAIAEKDSLLFGGYDFGRGNPALHMPNHWNSFRFEYSSPIYTQQDNADYSYRLEGFDKEWSGWSSRTEKDYTNLPYGNYTFSVRARNNLGNISLPVSYSFTVDPAWYETIRAYLLYFILAAGIFYWIRVQQQRRLALHQKKHEEEQAMLQYLHVLELDRKEKGLIALQNAKLEGELQFKNKELATVTMHLVERGGLLSNVKEELLAVIKKANVPNLSYDLRGVFKMISGTEKSDEDWNRFALYFDQVHNNFLSTLKTKFPQLSSADLKLCAYLRLNLSSKEIAQLLNISLKGVEVSRYRIRKKLNLASEVNLYDFLIETTHEG